MPCRYPSALFVWYSGADWLTSSWESGVGAPGPPASSSYCDCSSSALILAAICRCLVQESERANPSSQCSSGCQLPPTRLLQVDAPRCGSWRICQSANRANTCKANEADFSFTPSLFPLPLITATTIRIFYHRHLTLDALYSCRPNCRCLRHLPMTDRQLTNAMSNGCRLRGKPRPVQRASPRCWGAVIGICSNGDLRYASVCHGCSRLRTSLVH